MDPAHRVDDPSGETDMSGQSAPASPHALPLNFPGGVQRSAVRVAHAAAPTAILEVLGITPSGPALAVMGGAGLMTDESLEAVRRLIEEGLCTFAEAHRALIVDGGTTSGVMGLLGAVHRRRGYTFPLIGVVPESKVELPGATNPDKEAELDADHTHFVLVEGDDWGDESDVLAALALAGGIPHDGRPAALGVIINGGAIVAAEAHARATGALRFPLLVLDGSGRFADALAAAYHAGTSDDARIRAILEQGTVFVRSVYEDPAALRRWLEEFFGLPR
jgi:hypothetical protein